MGWTKRQLIVQAFEEIGIASYDFDLSAEQLASALRKLDSMMGTWNADGIRLGYPLPSSPASSSLAQDSGLPDRANEAVYTNLALRLASAVGRQAPDTLKIVAKRAYDVLLAQTAIPMEMHFPDGVPMGAGQKNLDRPFLADTDDELETGSDSDLEFK